MSQEARFTVFCLESYKQYRHLSGAETVGIFSRYGVFDYIREFYDVLHTTGRNYINHDIDIYLRARGAEVPATE